VRQDSSISSLFPCDGAVVGVVLAVVVCVAQFIRSKNVLNRIRTKSSLIVI